MKKQQQPNVQISSPPFPPVSVLEVGTALIAMGYRGTL